MKTILVDAIDGLVLKDGTIFKEMLDMLETFPNKKIVLTGANDEQFKEFNLDKVPYEVFTLKHNPEKTDPEYFKLMLEHYGLDANEVTFFEHNPEAAKSAETAGIKTYYYDPVKKDLAALKEFLTANLKNMKILKTKNFEVAANITGDKDAPKLAILMPGRLDTKDYINFTSHADYLSKQGYLVVAIDPPGTWDSPGDLNNYTTSTYVNAINELVDYFGNRPTLLLGHSRGGATAMLASANPAVDALVVVNAAYGNPTPPKPEEIENGVLVELRDLPPGNVRTEKKVRFELPMVYFEDGKKHNPKEALAKFKGSKLLVHATKDEFTELDKIKAIYDDLQEPKMFLAIDCTHDYRLFPEVVEQVNQKLGDFIAAQ